MLPSGFISKACSRKKLFSSAEPISASFAPSRLQKDWVKKINKLNYKKKKNIRKHQIKQRNTVNNYSVSSHKITTYYKSIYPSRKSLQEARGPYS